MTSEISGVRLGDLLTGAGLLKPADLREAMLIAKQQGLPVGRVLIMSAYLTEHQLQAAVRAQSMLKDGLIDQETVIKALTLVGAEDLTLESALKSLSWYQEDEPITNKLGELLLQAEIVTRDQLQSGLSQCQSSGMPLGRVLVVTSILSEQLLAAALNVQVLLRDQKLTREDAVQALKSSRERQIPIEQYLAESGLMALPVQESIRLGELLLQAGIVDENGVMNAVELGLVSATLIGEVFIEQGMARVAVIDAALKVQSMVANGTLKKGQAPNVLALIDKKNCSLEEAVKIVQPAPPPPPPPQEEPAAPAAPSQQAMTAERAKTALAETQADIAATAVASDTLPLYQYLQMAGLINPKDIETAVRVGSKDSEIMGRMLIAAGILPPHLVSIAFKCRELLAKGLLNSEQVIMALKTCHSTGASLEEVFVHCNWEPIALKEVVDLGNFDNVKAGMRPKLDRHDMVKTLRIETIQPEKEAAAEPVASNANKVEPTETLPAAALAATPEPPAAQSEGDVPSPTITPVASANARRAARAAKAAAAKEAGREFNAAATLEGLPVAEGAEVQGHAVAAPTAASIESAQFESVALLQAQQAPVVEPPAPEPIMEAPPAQIQEPMPAPEEIPPPAPEPVAVAAAEYTPEPVAAAVAESAPEPVAVETESAPAPEPVAIAATQSALVHTAEETDDQPAWLQQLEDDAPDTQEAEPSDAPPVLWGMEQANAQTAAPAMAPEMVALDAQATEPQWSQPAPTGNSQPPQPAQAIPPNGSWVAELPNDQSAWAVPEQTQPQPAAAWEPEPAQQAAAWVPEQAPAQQAAPWAPEQAPAQQAAAWVPEQAPAQQAAPWAPEQAPAQQAAPWAPEQAPAQQAAAWVPEQAPAQQAAAWVPEQAPAQQAAAWAPEQAPAQQAAPWTAPQQSSWDGQAQAVPQNGEHDAGAQTWVSQPGIPVAAGRPAQQQSMTSTGQTVAWGEQQGSPGAWDNQPPPQPAVSQPAAAPQKMWSIPQGLQQPEPVAEPIQPPPQPQPQPQPRPPQPAPQNNAWASPAAHETSPAAMWGAPPAAPQEAPPAPPAAQSSGGFWGDAVPAAQQPPAQQMQQQSQSGTWGAPPQAAQGQSGTWQQPPLHPQGQPQQMQQQGQSGTWGQPPLPPPGQPQQMQQQGQSGTWGQPPLPPQVQQPQMQQQGQSGTWGQPPLPPQGQPQQQAWAPPTPPPQEAQTWEPQQQQMQPNQPITPSDYWAQPGQKPEPEQQEEEKPKKRLQDFMPKLQSQ